MLAMGELHGVIRLVGRAGCLLGMGTAVVHGALRGAVLRRIVNSARVCILLVNFSKLV